MDNGQWRRVPSGVDVYVQGQVFSRTVDLAWGDPWSQETLFTDEQLKAKFRGMLKGLDERDHSGLADEIIGMVAEIETLPSLQPFADLLEQTSARSCPSRAKLR
ncbi:MAG: hypothetical protein AB7G13_24260 [Lautropia sp.]